MNDELKGVKGWLLLFVVIIALISPGWSAIQAMRAFQGENAYLFDNVPELANLRLFAWGDVAFAFLAGWFAAYRLVAVHNWTSVRIAIVVVWLTSVGSLAMQYAAVSWFLGLPPEFLASMAGPQTVIRPFVFALIWTSYLLKSERVQNTYRGGEEQAEVFE